MRVWGRVTGYSYNAGSAFTGDMDQPMSVTLTVPMQWGLDLDTGDAVVLELVKPVPITGLPLDRARN